MTAIIEQISNCGIEGCGCCGWCGCRGYSESDSESESSSVYDAYSCRNCHRDTDVCICFRTMSDVYSYPSSNCSVCCYDMLYCICDTSENTTENTTGDTMNENNNNQNEGNSVVLPEYICEIEGCECSIRSVAVY